MTETVNNSSGLEALSEYHLRRLTDPWTGELHSPTQETLSGVASRETFEDITGHWRKLREVYHDAAADAVFGDGAVLAEEVCSVAEDAGGDVHSTSFFDLFDGSFWVDAALSCVVLAVIVAYMVCAYRYYHDVVALIYSSFRRSAAVSDRVNERRSSDIFYGFLGKLFLLGIGGVGVMASIWAIRGGGLSWGFTEGQKLLSPLIGAGLFVALITLQYIVLLVVGYVTRSISTIHTLMRVRLTYFVLATVVVAPFLLIAQITEGQGVWRVVTLLLLALTLLLYVRESIDLFMSKKISILHWFLYLCTVEIVPLTLLWQIAIRLRS